MLAEPFSKLLRMQALSADARCEINANCSQIYLSKQMIQLSMPWVKNYHNLIVALFTLLTEQDNKVVLLKIQFGAN